MENIELIAAKELVTERHRQLIGRRTQGQIVATLQRVLLVMFLQRNHLVRPQLVHHGSEEGVWILLIDLEQLKRPTRLVRGSAEAGSNQAVDD